ncbi:MAG: glycine cleavage system protein H [Nitrososphaerota archaeon]
MSEKSILKEQLLTYDHFWIKVEYNSPTALVKIGLKEDVIKTIGQIDAFRALPKGRCVNRGYPFGSIEHGRKILILRSPITGSIVEVNEEVIKNPQLINEDPYGKGWIAILKPSNVEELDALL